MHPPVHLKVDGLDLGEDHRAKGVAVVVASLWQRRWKVKGVTVCLAMWVAAGGPYCSVATPESWRETSVTRRMERKEGSQRQPKVWVSCHVSWNSIKKSPCALLELPQWKIPLPGHGHTQSSKCLLYTPQVCHQLYPPSLSPAFVLFLTPAFLCTCSQLSSSKSNLCYIATFWKAKERLLIANLFIRIKANKALPK